MIDPQTLAAFLALISVLSIPLFFARTRLDEKLMLAASTAIFAVVGSSNPTDGPAMDIAAMVASVALSYSAVMLVPPRMLPIVMIAGGSAYYAAYYASTVTGGALWSVPYVSAAARYVLPLVVIFSIIRAYVATLDARAQSRAMWSLLALHFVFVVALFGSVIAISTSPEELGQARGNVVGYLTAFLPRSILLGLIGWAIAHLAAPRLVARELRFNRERPLMLTGGHFSDYKSFLLLVFFSFSMGQLYGAIFEVESVIEQVAYGVYSVVFLLFLATYNVLSMVSSRGMPVSDRSSIRLYKEFFDAGSALGLILAFITYPSTEELLAKGFTYLQIIPFKATLALEQILFTISFLTPASFVAVYMFRRFSVGPIYRRLEALVGGPCPSCRYPLRGTEAVCPNCGYRVV